MVDPQSTTLGGSDGGEPCLGCGACCFSRLESYVPVRGDDYARLGDRAEALVWFENNRAYLTMIDGHCIALVVGIDPNEDKGRFTCSIYADRPSTCRELHRGSPTCEGELHEKIDRPNAAFEASGLVRLRASGGWSGKVLL